MQPYYPPANIPNVKITERRHKKLEREQVYVLEALEKLRSLSVCELCQLAEEYVTTNFPVDLQHWARQHKNLPIMNRAFLACLNLVERGTIQCRLQ
ncbi:hypothetical protein HTZ97_13655 [Desulfuromonas acetoxidans]|uniref:hypothetical protein n=1 Tax=Desulfuromonas acetoxidans TaxID=891 RepID=UPI001594BE90|nr:hypothetical protein [Desulfuromonas acetoxidans]MBF0644884.1 hypothetical protein [Desulfuromonas acetoxidans]NVD25401.1 hypothetical protein [Desulfuromonas acetoxidans]NVE17498.1 hypothetical protein [Desulfuromonas acetoxidans]